MEVLWFLAGLVIGLIAWVRYRFHVNTKINHLLREIQSDALDVPLSSTSRLGSAIAWQQRQQRQLEQRLSAYQQILQIAPLGYLQVDDENRLLWCNVKAQDLLGIELQLSKRPRLLLELVRSYELDQLIEQARELQSPCQSDWVFNPVCADPQHPAQPQSYTLRGYAFPLLHDEVGIFLEDRQEAVNLAQQRDRWASDVAHELKTPLTSIRLVAETLQPRLDDSLQGWMTRLLNEITRLSTLVQDLLDLSQIQRDTTQSLKLQPTDLVELIHAAWQGLEPQAQTKQIQLVYIGPSQLVIQADTDRLYRVLLNLLDNALKYSPAKQVIQVQMTVDKGVMVEQGKIEGEAVQSEAPISTCKVPTCKVYLSVIDAGSGFPEASLPFVFDRFYRADPSRVRDSKARNMRGVLAQSPSSSGSGLGLAIVRQIIEAHQGTVKAANHPETGGGWLQITLPCHPIN